MLIPRSSKYGYGRGAVDRRTRAVIGLAFGDRSTTTCKKLWESLPGEYRKRAVLYTDDWKPYTKVCHQKDIALLRKEVERQV